MHPLRLWLSDFSKHWLCSISHSLFFDGRWGWNWKQVRALPSISQNNRTWQRLSWNSISCHHDQPWLDWWVKERGSYSFLRSFTSSSSCLSWKLMKLLLTSLEPSIHSLKPQAGNSLIVPTPKALITSYSCIIWSSIPFVRTLEWNQIGRKK